ncbi:MAG: hypothetical protein KF883_09015 [Thermomicrobiales bacterium]|nr:hypothetical protein [Thermomicrobiales bacterium]
MRLLDPNADADISGESEDARATVRAFLWVLFVFKIVTVIATVWAAGWTSEAKYILSITTWPWLIIPALALPGPLLYEIRVRRIRRRRAELQLSEWMIGEEPASGVMLDMGIGRFGERNDGN